MNKVDNPPAFPVPNDANVNDQMGMSLRDWFAGQALSGYFAHTATPHQNATDAGPYCYAMADAMIAERAAPARLIATDAQPVEHAEQITRLLDEINSESEVAIAAIAAWNTRAPSSALAEKDAMIEVAAQAIYEDARKACREMAKGAQHADFVSDDYIKGFETGLHAADVAILIRANAYHLKTLADLDGAR